MRNINAEQRIAYKYYFLSLSVRTPTTETNQLMSFMEIMTLPQEPRRGNKGKVQCLATVTAARDTCNVARHGASAAKPTFRLPTNGNVVRSTLPSSLRL